MAMGALSDYVVIRSAPDIEPARFAALLAAGGSPALPEAGAIYQAVVARAVSPLFALAVFMHESRLGLEGICARYQTRSLGNVRTPHLPEHGGQVIQTERGAFVAYPTWAAGAADWAERLRGPRYAGAGLVTVRQILPVYAPGSDGNQPDAYAAAVLAFIARYRRAPEGAVMAVAVIDRLTPVNYRPGRNGRTVRAIVLHITDGDTAAGALSWFRNPESGVSAHYVIDRDGTVYRAVAEADTAWANGILNQPDLTQPLIRRWAEERINPNLETVSIEAAGRPEAGWTAEQVTAARALVADIAARHGLVVSPLTVLRHRDLDRVNRARCPSLTDEQFAAILAGPPAAVDPVDAALEAAWQREQAALGEKRFKAHVERPGFAGDILVCQRGVVAAEAAATARLREILVDDLVTYLEGAGVLRRY
jgi:hypothetical protein